MAEINSRFTSHGQPLEFWMQELVCDEMGRRSHAGEIIQQMFMAMPNDIAALQQFDPKGSQEVFYAEVRRIMDAPGFDTRQYLSELIELLRTAQIHRMELWHVESERQDEYL